MPNLSTACLLLQAVEPADDGWEKPVIFEYTEDKAEAGCKGVFFQGKEVKLGKGDWVLKVDSRNNANQWFVDVATKDPTIKPRYVATLLAKSRALEYLARS